MLMRRWRWSLIVLAAATRVAAVLVLQSHTIPRSTYEHGEIAANLVAGRGFSVKFLGAEGPTSQQAPLYPLVVAGAYAIGGVETPRSLLILELGQAVLGGLLVAGALALAGEVAPGRRGVAVVAGLIAAVHPTLVYAATHVQVALLAATLLTWTLALAYRAGRTGRWTEAVGAGIGLGLVVLTDPILGLVAPGAAWAIRTARGNCTHLSPRTERGRPRSDRVRGLLPCGTGFASAEPGPSTGRASGTPIRPLTLTLSPQTGRGDQSRPLAVRIAIVALVAALVVAPWSVRNYVVHGEPVFIKSTFGYAFWQGNCSLSEGTDKVVRPSVERVLQARSDGVKGLNESLWKARHEAGYLDDIALTRADYAELSAVSEPERSRRLFRRAVADLRADPWRYPTLCLRRLRYFVLFDETNPKTRSLVYRASHLGLTVLAAIGLLLAPRELRRQLGPTLLTAGLIAAFHALTIVSARFHLPIEPLMGLWAGCGSFAPRRQGRRKSVAIRLPRLRPSPAGAG